MTAMFTAELLKLRRRRIAIAVVVGAVAFAAVSTIAVFLSATDEPFGDRSPTTLATLGQAGGATEAFTTGISFTGILVLVLFIANFTSEFSRGTFRTLLMREPRRIALLAGKLGALLTFAAAVLALVALLTVGISIAIAPTQDVSTSSWFSLDGLGEAVAAYTTAVATVAAWGSLGVALALVVRSAPIALAIGVAWSGPFENLTSDVWSGALEWFPGLLLQSFAVGGTDDASFTRALVLLSLYVGAALGVAAWTFSRRDITT